MSFLKELQHRFLGVPRTEPDSSDSDRRVVKGIDAEALPGRRRHLEIVGEYYHQPAIVRVLGADARDGINFSTVAILLPDPSNQHDHNAVEVRIDGQRVGYLSREQAVGYHKAMSTLGSPDGAIVNVEARIFGRPLDDENHGGFGVAIYLPESIAKQIGYGSR